MRVRGKDLIVVRHAFDGMESERPPIRLEDVLRALEEPEHDAHGEARAWIGFRTIIVRYKDEGERIVVRSVSATRRRLD